MSLSVKRRAEVAAKRHTEEKSNFTLSPHQEGGFFLHFIFLTFLFSIQTLNRKPKYEIQVQKSNLTRLQIFTNSLV